MPPALSIAALKKRFDINTMQRESGCIEWMGGQSFGYGAIRFKGKTRHAHTVIWELETGRKLPKGRLVRHLCHNRLCVNVEHLEVGTHKDNREDSRKDNRLPVGKQNGNTKYSEDQVREVKLLLTKGFTKAEISRLTKIPYKTIESIWNGKCWAWLKA